MSMEQKKELKYKIGDKVTIEGIVLEAHSNCEADLAYMVQLGSDSDCWVWITQKDVEKEITISPPKILTAKEARQKLEAHRNPKFAECFNEFIEMKIAEKEYVFHIGDFREFYKQKYNEEITMSYEILLHVFLRLGYKSHGSDMLNMEF